MASVALSGLLERLESGSRPRGGVKRVGRGVVSLGAEHLDGAGGFDFRNAKYVPPAFFAALAEAVMIPALRPPLSNTQPSSAISWPSSVAI